MNLVPKFSKFLLTLPNGNEKCILADDPENFEGFFLPSLPPADEEGDFSKKFIFLYEISAALVYIGEMSTLTSPPRMKMPFGRKRENLFSVLSSIHLDGNACFGRKKEQKNKPSHRKFL